ncbi:MAG: hypothetical protein COW71_08825 [Ignavibacteriales bacterium CG18_big_fil_WC_8_21_14_2_50_31_20]|nr:MAG: hypothetical protein COW71_08825 [Ignavibacteriales bacterium CG18_big_fil_WC_8_21_14_2_50_31_20]
MQKILTSPKIFVFFLLLTFNFTQAQDFDCSDCHETKIVGVHLDAIGCADCHSDVEDENHADTGVKKVNCLDCHEDYESSVKNDIHSKIGIKKGNPNCVSCHGNHTIIAPSKFKNPTKEYCGKCHTNGRVVLTSSYHSNSSGETTCAECHEIDDYKPILSTSVHNGLACVDCHGYVANNIEKHQDGLHKREKANCYSCHNNVAKLHAESVHGLALAGGEEDAAMCWNCHGSHQILPSSDSLSMINTKNIGTTCGTCHDDPAFEEKFHMSLKLPGKMYSQSVHGKLVMSGNKEAANCTSCHGFHTIKDRVQENSQISPINVPTTCGKCHSEIVEEYKNSIHWIRAKKGIKDAPVCNDCHSEHNIEDITVSDKKAYRLKMQDKTCISCHNDARMNQKFGAEGKEVEQYLNSYHGLAAYRGGSNAALCIDCHGVHSILQSSDPNATINKANVTQTCRKCHENATEVFSISYSHETESAEAKQIEDLVKEIYFWLIITVIGGMAIHNLIIFLFEIRRKRRKDKNVITVPRFTQNEVIQHFLLLTSFIILAITGFALKYPNSFWSEGLLTLGMTEAVRSITHRVAAVIMTVLSFYHLFYLIFTARGRNVLFEMIPTFRDLRDAIDNILYYLHFKKKHPHFNQYDYAEKAEYWALIWGTFVMGLTGLVLWFPTIVDTWTPIWLIKVAEIIHFYEAILATLAILVWHWFFVIIHPKEYPMSFTWVDGKMSIGHYREHHENHFRKLLLEWNNYKINNIERRKLSNFMQLFLDTVEKNGSDPDEVLQNELNNDPELFVWFDSMTSTKNNE